MSVKYLVGLENFLFFHEKYRVFVSRFRFAYIFLTRFILQRNELPYMPKGGDKRCLKILFLDQLPLGLGKRILENESWQEMMKVKDLETLMNHVDTVVDKFRKQHMLFRASQRTLLGDTEYDTRYGKYDTVLKKMPDMRYTPKAGGKLSELGEVTEASNVGDVLANLQTQHEQLKVELKTMQEKHELELAESQFMLAYNDTVNKGQTKPLFTNNRKTLKPESTLTTPTGGTIKEVKNEPPKVCFGDFWMGTCSRPKCEYCGANAVSNGRKYWDHAMKQLISHKYKSYKDVIVWTKDGKVIKPELVKDRERGVQATMHQVAFSDEEEHFPGDKEEEEDEEYDLGT
jgi:hypothetical protein